MTNISELKKIYKEGRLVPFVGAGVSMSVSWKKGNKLMRGPSWEELVNEAASQMGFDNPALLRVRGTDIQILEYFKIKKNNQTQTLKNWLVKLMEPPTKALKESVIHKELAALKSCNLFYTTNFDDFIEKSFKENGRQCRVVAIEEEMGCGGNDCEIVKFHGDLNHPTDMVLSESEYERRLALSTVMDYRLKGDMLGRVLLFLGYSFRDVNVSYLFRVINEQFGKLDQSTSKRRAYIIFPEPSDFEITLFKARNIEVIPVESNDLSANVASVLHDLRS